MRINRIYKSIIERRNLWDYYQTNVVAPDLTNYKDCERFIIEYIKCSEKSNTKLFHNIIELSNYSPQRLSHIVSTFFLGLWLFHHKEKCIHNSIIEELSKLRCFRKDDIEKQFAYVWLMATLFHDLGYPAEETGLNLPTFDIPFVGSVPKFYRNVYKDYYERFRKNREHGIYAGLTFDNEICEIRRIKCNGPDSQLDWRVELEELYHYVAWIILAHNIWMIRDNDKNVGDYKNVGLDDLILSSEKNSDNHYVEYRIRFEEYPLLSFFCIIDTIEPLKSTSCLSNIDIQLKSGKMNIKSNDSVYLRKVKGLNDWLSPTIIKNDVAEIQL